MHRAKNLSYNRKVGNTTEKHQMSVHEKTIHALNLRRIRMMDEAEKKRKNAAKGAKKK